MTATATVAAGTRPGAGFDDRSVKLATTIGGAGVIHGDLTPECAEFVQTVLDALSAPAGADDDRTHEQRYHDALQEAMRRLIAAGLVPRQGGQPVKVWAYISLADLMQLEGSAELVAEWIGAAGGPVGRAPGRRRRGRRPSGAVAGRGRRAGDRVRRAGHPGGGRGREPGRVR